jgi:replication factor C subunit 2/4
VDTITSMVGFQVCDQPHPLHVKNMVRHVLEGKFDDACSGLKQLYDLGYSPTDIITTLFRIIKNYDMAEYLKLEFMKVQIPCQPQ